MTEPARGGKPGGACARRRRRGLVVLGLLGAAACTDPAVTAPPLAVPEATATAFVDVSVLPMTGAGVQAHQTVLVVGDAIAAVGPVAEVAVPAGATVVDGRGRFLMPGLVDAHSHVGTNYSEFTNVRPPDAGMQTMAEGQLLLYLASGVTTILGNGDFVEPVMRWARDVRDGVYPGPTVYAAMWARGSTGTPDGGPPSRAVTTAEQARAHVVAAHDAGFDFIKVYNWTPAAALPAIVETAQGLGMGVLGHLPQTVPPAEALEGGLDMVTHAEAYLWTWFGHEVRPEGVAEMVARTLAAGAAVTTTLDMSRTTAHVWGGNRQGIAAFWSRPENRYMHWTEVALHREGIEGARWRPPGSRPGDLDTRNAFVRSYTRALYDAGVPLLAGTDAPTVLGVAGFSLHRELAELRDGLGLTPREVLRIATRNGGDFIGRFVSDDLPFGTVTAGSRADLLLLEANPLDDLDNLVHRVVVMARGRLYDEARLRLALDALAARYAGVCCPR